MTRKLVTIGLVLNKRLDVHEYLYKYFATPKFMFCKLKTQIQRVINKNKGK